VEEKLHPPSIVRLGSREVDQASITMGDIDKSLDLNIKKTKRKKFGGKKRSCRKIMGYVTAEKGGRKPYGLEVTGFSVQRG